MGFQLHADIDFFSKKGHINEETFITLKPLLLPRDIRSRYEMNGLFRSFCYGSLCRFCNSGNDIIVCWRRRSRYEMNAFFFVHFVTDTYAGQDISMWQLFLNDGCVFLPKVP